MKITKYKLAFLVLIFGFLLRGLFLEYTDLIDPTEARYASVAQEMLLTEDWLTPKLPMPEGVIPYLGKPPLHFWVTALSYKLFGFEEWSARLPSLIATLLILFFVYDYTRRFFSKDSAIVAALITFSSGMMFFLSGASVTDVTLTAMITASTVYLYRYITEQKERTCLLAVTFAALAFLCKGPVAIVLIALPFLLWSLTLRDFKWLATFPFVRSILIFSALVLPWFFASELQNPGFIKYFVWNENIARYLFKEYGDLYGSGHVHTYGMSWLMLFAAFMPWSIVLLVSLYYKGFKHSWSCIRSDKTLLFVLYWGISAGLFFTFVRQLHAMYLLPSIPALGILTAQIIYNERLGLKLQFNLPTKITILTFWLGVIIAGAILYFYEPSLVLAMAIFLSGAALIFIKKTYDKEEFVTSIAAVLFCTYLIVITAMTPYVNLRRSSETALKFLVSQAATNDVQNVGIFTRNNYSHYWTSNAWESELGRKINLYYLAPEKEIPSQIQYLLIKADKGRPETTKLFKNIAFNVTFKKGGWLIYKREGVAG